MQLIHNKSNIQYRWMTQILHCEKEDCQDDDLLHKSLIFTFDLQPIHTAGVKYS